MKFHQKGFREKGDAESAESEASACNSLSSEVMDVSLLFLQRLRPHVSQKTAAYQYDQLEGESERERGGGREIEEIENGEKKERELIASCHGNCAPLWAFGVSLTWFKSPCRLELKKLQFPQFHSGDGVGARPMAGDYTCAFRSRFFPHLSAPIILETIRCL